MNDGRNLAEADIYDGQGRRKYLTAGERTRFRVRADLLSPQERNLCLMYYFTGARISEALAVTVRDVDYELGVVVLRTLKRRNPNVFRAVPLPCGYLRALRRMVRDADPETRIWPYSRKTAYRKIKAVMAEARIYGVHASPKGLRHGFGVACVQNNIPLPTITKWMGHSSIKTTAIYLNVVGREEREFAKRIW